MEKQNKKLLPSEQAFINYLSEFPEGARMLNSLKTDSTKILYGKAVKFLCEFLGKNPTQIVQEYQRDIKENLYEASDKWERIFKDFSGYLGKLGYESATVALYFTGAKNLVNTNVPRRMAIAAKTPSATSRTIAGVSFEVLKEIWAIANVRERAILAFLKDSGMSRGDVLPLNIGVLENFDKGDEFIHLQVFRGKEKVEYETFIGPNAVEALRAYFTLRRSRGENLTAQSPLFATEEKPIERLTEKGLSTMFTRLTLRSGKRISSHRLRKFFETYMALVVRSPVILKLWMGHKIAKGRDVESRYIIPPTPEQSKLYQESYHNIDLIGGTLEQRAREAAKAEFEKMLMEGRVPEAREYAHTHNIRYYKRKGKAKSEKSDCPDGKNCGEENFKQIREDELLGCLQQGWEIVHRLSDGQLIVKNT
jgi:integrase